MKLLLPPSEGKTAATEGEPLDLDELFLPELRPFREKALDALSQASSLSDASATLKVGPKLREEVIRNTGLLHEPAQPAWSVYTGVLFEAMNLQGLGEEKIRRIGSDTLVFSALFGAVRVTDRIPAYRLSIGVKLHPFEEPADNPGPMATYWRNALRDKLQENLKDELIIDCRSSSYVSAFKTNPELTIMVNNYQELNGERKVITHFAKRARGELAGMILRASTTPETAPEVAEIAASRWEVELIPGTTKKPGQLNLIEKQPVL